MDPRIADLALIVTRTPLWVWPILALLTISGVTRLKPRSVPLARVVIVPVVFLVWGLGSLCVRLADRPMLGLAWFAAAVLGSALGWLTSPAGIRADREHRRIHMPGSAAPLVASLTVFTLKYACNVAAAIRPDNRAWIAVIDMAISGASASYFWSGLVRVLLRYRSAASSTAPRIDTEPNSVPISA